MRTLSKKQIQALLKVCSKNKLRPGSTTLAIVNDRIQATDGYAGVLIDMAESESERATDENIPLDLNKIKQRLAVMSGRDGLSLAELAELSLDDDLYKAPDLMYLTEGVGDKGQTIPFPHFDPSVMARAMDALTAMDYGDDTNYASFYTEWSEDLKIVMRNRRGDAAIVMGLKA